MRILSANNPRVLAALMLVAAFVAGVASTLAFNRIRARDLPSTMVTVDMRRELPAEFRGLNLNAQQRERILTVLDSARRQTMQMFQSFEPQLQQLLDSVDVQTQAVLTADQRQQLAVERAKRPRKMVQQETTINGRTTRMIDTSSH